MLTRTRDATAYLPELRQPGGVRRWLLSARKAHWVAAICLVAGLTVVPPVRDVLLEAVLSPVTVRGGFLGLATRRREHPKLPAVRTAFNTVYWLGSGCAVLWLLWLHLPVAFRHRQEDEPNSEGANAAATAPTLLSPAGGATPSGGSTLRAAVAPSANTSGESRPGGPYGAETPGGDGRAEPGVVIAGRYAIEVELGRGAMGVVYRARDQVLDRTVAFKELPAHLTEDAALVERFRREARALARLSHPHIVQVHDLVESGRQLWMAMELVTGGSVEQELERQGKLSFDRALELARQMAEALAHAHEQGVIHRDFKPANVMLDRTGSAKVTDFGLAKLSLDPGLTQAGAVMGSPSYMSPEQATGGEADARSDIYALGATVYEMLTGAPPFVGADVTSVLVQHITTAPVPPRDRGVELPEPMEALLLAMLEKEPVRRPAGMEEVAGKLRELRQQ